MKNSLIALSSMLMLGGTALAQKVTFEEYDLPNGLHVILHNDSSAPVVITSVMYHVGSKDDPNKWMGHYVASRFGKKAYHLGLFAREGESFEWWSKKNISYKNDSTKNVEFLINPSSEITLFMDFTRIKPRKRPEWMEQYAVGFEVENGRNVEFIPSRRFDGIVVVGKGHAPTY